VTPNTGSFFKNPVVDAAQYATLKQRYPQLGGYVQPDGQIKLAAGWLIDQAGWRGRPLGPVSMYAKQALVLVNLQRGQLADVYALSDAVCDAVQHQFGVVLSREPVDVQTIFNPVTGECA
jgi:UDP-N-acetylmuramate dehydrogenase